MIIAVITGYFIELFLLVFIIFIHELGHACVAEFFQWRIKKINLLPFGGVVEMDEHGNRPLKEEFIVTIAGPVQNLWLFGLAFLLFQTSILPENIYFLFIQYNFMVLFFNLLPIWPLDGGKLAFIWLSRNKAFPMAHRMTIYFSFIGTFIFTLFTLLFMPQNVNAWLIIGFLLFSLYHERKQSRYVFIRFLLERYYGKKNNVSSLKPLIVKEDEMIIDVLERFQRGYKHPIIVNNDGKEKGSLDENELLHAYFTEKQITSRIGDLLYLY